MKRRKLYAYLLMVGIFLALNSINMASDPPPDFEEFNISFSYPEIMKFGKYDFVQIAGTSYIWDVGKPMLPEKGIQVLIEDREIDSIEIVSSDSIAINGSYYIQPVQHAVANFTMPSVEPDVSMYGSDDIYPSNILENAGVSRMRDYPLLGLLVRPIQYKLKSRKLTFYQNLTIRIYYKDEYRFKTAAQTANPNISQKRRQNPL